MKNDELNSSKTEDADEKEKIKLYAIVCDLRI